MQYNKCITLHPMFTFCFENELLHYQADIRQNKIHSIKQGQLMSSEIVTWFFPHSEHFMHHLCGLENHRMFHEIF